MVPGLWLNEGGPVGSRSRHRPPGANAPRRPREAARLAAKSGASALAPGWPNAQPRRGGAAAVAATGRPACTWCRSSSEIARLSPIRTQRRLIAGMGMDAEHRQPRRSLSRRAARTGIRRAADHRGAAQRRHSDRYHRYSAAGAGQSPLARQVLADATGLTVAASTSPEPVLLGSGYPAAVAAGRYGQVSTAMSAMSELGDVYQSDPAVATWHSGRFKAFEKLQGNGAGEQCADRLQVSEAG